jgi:Flp pilus assembly pilin Flp
MALGLIQTVEAVVIRSRRLAEDRGAVSTEYGLLLGLIALVVIVAMTAFGVAVANLLQQGADGF